MSHGHVYAMRHKGLWTKYKKSIEMLENWKDCKMEVKMFYSIAKNVSDAFESLEDEINDWLELAPIAEIRHFEYKHCAGEEWTELSCVILYEKTGEDNE